MSAATILTTCIPISTPAHILAIERLPDTSHLPSITLVDCKMTYICDLTIRRGLLFLIIFTPLALGCTYPWGIALMECVVLFMALAWVFTLLHTGRVRLVCTPLNLPILLFFGLIGLQLLPLPPIVLSWLSPHTYDLYQTNARSGARHRKKLRRRSQGRARRADGAGSAEY